MIDQAKALLAANDLDGAIAAAVNYVKAKPTDATARTFLFELLIFAGEFDRAEKQLDVLGQQDANALVGTQIYRQCIACERKRQRVFAAEAVPEFFTAKPAYVSYLIDAVRELNNKNAEKARELLDKSENDRPANKGKINDAKEFEDFRDYNDLTASILEVFLKGEYLWIPIEFVQKIEVCERKSLRDVCWTQIKIEMRDGTNGEAHIPALYFGSNKNADGEIRLGKATDWTNAGSEVFTGAGMRVFWFDGDSAPFVNVDKIEFDTGE
jgi:type VI secretion system protein ImpE